MNSPCCGTDGLQVGNGNHIPILSVGSNSIPIYPAASSSKSLLLSNILYAPQITKNLLSISHFTKDKNVLIEFHTKSCFVKDKRNNILLKGSLSKGLYHVDLSSVQPHTQASGHSSASAQSSALVSIKPCITNKTTSTHCNTVVNNDVSYSHPSHFAALCKLNADTLHQMFGHPNNVVLTSLCASLHIPFSTNKLQFCEACKLGKLHQKSHV